MNWYNQELNNRYTERERGERLELTFVDLKREIEVEEIERSRRRRRRRIKMVNLQNSLLFH
jgi:hypothetical protein